MTARSPAAARWPFIGQAALGDHVVEVLDRGTLPRVVLFVGPRHVGKATATWWLVQRSLCSASLRPCGQCPSCRQMAARQHPLVAAPDDHSSTIGREEILRLLQLWQTASIGAEQRWLLLNDVDRLTEAASTMLLKFLEELPSQTRVLMTSSDETMLLPTIISRAALYRWHLVALKEMTDQAIRRWPERQTSSNRRLAEQALGRPGWLYEAPWASDEPRSDELLGGDIRPWVEQRCWYFRDQLFMALGVTGRAGVTSRQRSATSPKTINDQVRRLERHLEAFDLLRSNIQPRLLNHELVLA